MLIFIFFIIFPLVLTDISLASVKITEGNFVMDEYEMKIYDHYLPKDKPIDISVSAKIIYLSSFERYLDIIDIYEGYYNDRWVNNIK